MQTALRKIGNSTGLLLPRPLLGELGVTAGSELDLKVEDGRLVATPVPKIRAGWAEAAAEVGREEVGDDGWLAFRNEDDTGLDW